jgi:hypothetical protein
MRGKASLLHGPNEPFRRIILVPSYSVPVVHRELMMEVVVAFTYSNESCDHVVARSELVIERTVAKPMSERINTES